MAFPPVLFMSRRLRYLLRMRSVHRGVTRLDGPGPRSKFGAPCLNLRSFGTKLIALKKVLVTLLGFFGISHSDSAPRKLCAPHVTPLTVQYLAKNLAQQLTSWVTPVVI